MYKFTLLFLSIITLCFASCKPVEPEETLILSVASISASALNNSYEVNVTTTAKDFTVTSDSAWCIVTPDISKMTFSIVLAANNINTIRKTKVKVTAGTKSALVSITQAAGVFVPVVLTPTKRDSLALLSLNTGTTKWNTAQSLNTWAGVKVELVLGYRRVTELNIPATNVITGAISDSIKNLTQLIYLDISGNNLSGTIPTLSGLNNLIVLDMKNNKLSGNVPALPVSLAYLSLGQNNLSGTLPIQIKDLTLLMILDLGLNDLTGTVPAEWSSLFKIKYFYLYGNKLSGTIPIFLSSFVKMEALALDYNQLTGSIPTGIGSLTTLQKLTLQQNKLTGVVPADLLSNPNWSTWSSTVLPQQDGITLSGAPAGAKAFKIGNEKETIPVYNLPDKRLFNKLQ